MAHDSGIRLKASHELMGRQAGGRDTLGFIKQDQKNYLRTKRKKSLQYGGKTIFTYQDSAMAKAMSLVMPTTYHCLCFWHIMQNAMRHIGHLFKEGSKFSRRFNACIFDYRTEEELFTH